MRTFTAMMSIQFLMQLWTMFWETKIRISVKLWKFLVLMNMMPSQKESFISYLRLNWVGSLSVTSLSNNALNLPRNLSPIWRQPQNSMINLLSVWNSKILSDILLNFLLKKSQPQDVSFTLKQGNFFLIFLR